MSADPKVIPFGQPILGPITGEVLTQYRREEAQKAELVRACLVVRSYLRPTRTDVLEALDSVESMAYSFMEQGGWYGDVESAFERVRSALDVRRQPSYEQAKFDARDAWNGVGEDDAGVGA